MKIPLLLICLLAFSLFASRRVIAGAVPGVDYAKPIPTYPDRNGFIGFGYGTPGSRHLADDYGAPEGTNVFALLDGTVTLSGNVGGYGSSNPSTAGGVIIIRHRDKNNREFYALYGHLKNRLVSVGHSVTKGQKIAELNGYTNGVNYWPHLHMSINTSPTGGTEVAGYESSPAFVGPYSNYHDPVPWLRDNVSTTPQPIPGITGVGTGNTVPPNASRQWIEIRGRDFVDGFSCIFRDITNNTIYPEITDPARLRFQSSSRIEVFAGVGVEVATWGVRVRNPGGQLSNEQEFDVQSGGGTASLVYQGNVIHDGTGGGAGNDDGQINAGEEIDLDVYLRNTGSGAATGISATLSSSSSYVTITDANENWPDISPGDTEPCNADFDFDVSSSAPAGHTMNFTLSITSDQGSWTRSFSLQVAASGAGGDVDIEYYSHRIDDDTNTSNGNDDGIVNPGETIELPVTLRNTGTDTAHNVDAVLSTSSPYITITDNDRTWGDIAGGATDESSDFDFIVDDSCPDGHVAQFSLVITADEGSWSDSFTITVVGNPSGGPNFICAGSVVHDGTGGGRGNGNGSIDAGEEIDLDVLVSNNGDVAATGVAATISTSDPYVVIKDGAESLPDIGAGATRTTNGDFDFSILQSCPIGRTIEFDLSITSDQGTSETTFTVQVLGALPVEPLQIISFSIAPGSLNITVTSQVEENYTIWRSHDLVNWSPLFSYTGRAMTTSTEIGGAIGTVSEEFYKVTKD